MGCAEKYNGVAGSSPEFGAIFMANIVTKKECFKHNVFALPSSQAEFVKHVKAGMVLFLFEYQKRQLFGVYQATSDGTHYEGIRSHFPAQVSFTPIWYCSPISEKEFRDAIRENYFSAYKFNFGLSEDQVHRLLLLFSSTKLKKKVPRHLHTKLGDGASGENRGLVGDDRLELSQGTYMDPNGDFYLEASSDYQESPFTRAKEDELFIDRTEIEREIYPEEQGFLAYGGGDYLERRRRLDYDDRLLMTDVGENRLHNNEVRKLADYRWSSNKNQVDKILNPVHSADYTVGPSEVRTADDERFKQRNRLYGDFNMDNGFGLAHASEHYVKSINRGRLPINDNSFTIDDRVQREYNLLNIIKPVVYDGHQFSADGNLKNRYHMDYDSSSRGASVSENFHNLRKTTAGIKERIDREPKFASPYHDDHREIHDDTIPIVGENLTEYPSFSKTKQNLYSSFDKCAPEKGLFRLTVGQSFPIFRSAFGNATIAKSNPYVPELTNITHKYSSPLATDKDTNLVQENLPYHGSEGNFYSSKNRSSPYVLEPKKSNKCLDVASELGNKGYLSTRQSTTPHANAINSNSSVHTDLHTFAPVGYNDSLFSKVSSTFMPSNNRDHIEGGKEWLHYPSRSSENHFTLDGNLLIPSQCMSEHDSRQKMDMSKGKDSRFSEAKDFSVGVHHHPERDLTSKYNMLFRISNNRNINEDQEISKAPPRSDSNVRRSVFTRLTSGQEVQVDEERNDHHFNCLNSYMDASADEVMTMLHQGNNPPQRKQKKFKVPTHGVAGLDKKQIQTRDEINRSTKENKPNGASLPVEEGFDDVLAETRIVDFKRRSERKKSFFGTKTESTAANNLTAVEIYAKKVLKRKRLVRPIFGKNESVTDGLDNNQNAILSGQNLEKDDKQSCDTTTIIYEPKISNIKSFDELASSDYQSIDCNIKEKSKSEAEKDIQTLVSVSPELKGNKTSNVGLQTCSSGVVKETTEPKPLGIQTGTKGILATDVDANVSRINIAEPSSDGLKLGAICGKKIWLSKNRESHKN